MRNIKITITYDGTNYCGWQKQDDKKTVEGEIEKVLSKILKEEVDIKGSGRTDAGVHAYGQVANFKTNQKISTEDIKKACNTLLPKDIVILEAEEEDEVFDSRKSARAKHYKYIVNNVGIHDALNKDRKYNYKYTVDMENMKEAASYIIGEHNFTAFSSVGSSSKKVVQTIYRLDIVKEGEDIIIDIEGSGFLYKMVRTIVGTLLEVGSGKLKPEIVIEMLKTKDRTLGGKTAPAFGLYLVKVIYE